MFRIDEEVLDDRSRYTMYLTRGDYACFDIDLVDFNGDPYVLQEGEIVTFTVKKNSRTKEALIQKTGTTIQIEGSDTDDLRYGRYIYDAELTHADGRRDTFLGPDDFYITDEVTF